MKKKKTKDDQKYARILQAIYRGDSDDKIAIKLKARRHQIEKAKRHLEKEGISSNAELLTYYQASVLLGLSKRACRVSQLVREGRITPKTIGHHTLIPRDELLRFAEEHNSLGRRRTTIWIRDNGKLLSQAEVADKYNVTRQAVAYLIRTKGREGAIKHLRERNNAARSET